MSFGSTTVTFIAVTGTGNPDALGNKILTETRTDVPGCLHRPVPRAGIGEGVVRAEQEPEIGVSVATQAWRTTIPLSELSGDRLAAVLAAKPSDVIEVNGVRFEIIDGVGNFDDFARPFKATITSERQDIG